MKRLLLVGGGHAHCVVLRALAEAPLYGARVTLVSPHDMEVYSAMLPGLVAGHYRRGEAEIDVARLALNAYAEFIRGEVVALDPSRRSARLADGREVGFELVSLDVGSQVERALPGAERALPVRPFGEFIAALGVPRRVAVVGAGAGGAELSMALRWRGAAVTLFSAQPSMPPALAGRALRAMRSLGVDFRPGMPVDAIEPGPVVVAGGARQEFDAVVLATSAAAPAWLRSAGLATDERGWVLVDTKLRSISHPHVFAAGDCAALRGAALPKSGVYAVRQGEVLAQNLRHAVNDRPLVDYRPQAHALVLLSCGGRTAIAARGGWSAQGWWVWRWKNWIDRRWVRSFSALGHDLS